MKTYLPYGFAIALGNALVTLICYLLGFHSDPDKIQMAGYLAMPVGLGLLVLQYLGEVMSLLTGRTPPFGIPEKAGAEEIIQEQAREALGGAG